MFIRNEKTDDYRVVEEMIKRHFGTYLYRDAMNIILLIWFEIVKISFQN